jgi:tetratricopeptide (TPR) repeat protein
MAKLARGASQLTSSTGLADRGAEAIRLGRFKEAMELFKQLARQDPQPQWRERLADAYAGRARALAGKAMFKEAAIVLENTMTAEGIVREPTLYLTCLIRERQYQKAAKVARKYLLADPGAADADRVGELAAALSLTEPASTATAVNAAATPPYFAARAALDAWSQGKPAAEIDALLSGLSLRSSYGPWRLILKSLAGLHGEPEKARALLGRIPPSSVFTPIRAAAEVALVADATVVLNRWSGLSGAQRRFVAEVRGLPSAAADLLGQIIDAERRGPDALFAMLIRPGLALPAAALRAACLDLLPANPGSISQFERRFGPLSPLERHRTLALAAEARGNGRQAKEHWDRVVAGLASQGEPDTRLAQGVVLRHLAWLATSHPEIRVGPGVDPVAYHLERSLEADPAHLPATLQLLGHYRQAGDAKAWYRLSEMAVGQFPENTAILQQALDAAVARNAFKKAAGFAHRLLRLDPINSSVRQRMIELLVAHARKQMRANRADLAGKALLQAAAWERPDVPSALLRTAQALVEWRDEDPVAEPRLLEAIALSGGGTVGWFCALLEAALMGWTEQRRRPLQRHLAMVQAGVPDRDAILSLITALGQKEIRERKRVVTSILWRIDPWLQRGSTIPWSATEFQAIAVCLHALEAFESLRAYAQEAICRDPGDQAARFYRIVAATQGDSARLSKSQENELSAFLEPAAPGQDFHLLNQVRRFLARGGDEPISDDGSDELSVEELEEFLDHARSEMAGLPEKKLRRMVSRLGLHRTIEVLVEAVNDTPLGAVLSEREVANFCALMVARATGSAVRVRRDDASG